MIYCFIFDVDCSLYIIWTIYSRLGGTKFSRIYVWEWSGVEFATDGQSASTSLCRAAHDEIFTCSLVWQVHPSSSRTPSLTRGRACILQSTSLSGQSREGSISIYYSLIWDSPDLQDQVPVFISPGTRWPSYIPRHRVPFSSLLTPRRVTVEVF
jgi:hypothetical protein